MTIPRTRAFNCTKGFQAQADVGINSPNQSNTQSVNVNIVSPLTKDRAIQITTDEEHKERKELDVKERCADNVKLDSPLDDELEPNFKERSIDTARQSLTEMEALLKDKDNLIEALSLILDIYENNPLIVNKLIVAQEEELTRLLFLLTGAEQIELVKSDPDIKCCVKADKFTHIQKIMIKKDGNMFNFKYSFPNVIQLLDNRRICWKIVC